MSRYARGESSHLGEKSPVDCSGARRRCRALYELEPEVDNEEFACIKRQKIRESDQGTDGHEHAVGCEHELGVLKRLQKLRAEYNPHHKYVQHRQLLVGFIIEVCEDLELEPLTMHAALNYLDRILSKRSISRQCYHLVATVCILIAAKVEEQQNNIPTLSALARKSITGVESKEQLVEVERILLGHLEWNAMAATQLHFLQCYVAQGVLFAGDTVHAQPLTATDRRLVLRHMDFLSVLSLQDYSLLQYDQATVAAAAVAVARSACEVEPEWPLELAEAVGVSEHDLAPCRDHLCALFAKHLPPRSPVPSQCSKVAKEGQAGLVSSPKCVVSVALGSV